MTPPNPATTLLGPAHVSFPVNRRVAGDKTGRRAQLRGAAGCLPSRGALASTPRDQQHSLLHPSYAAASPRPVSGHSIPVSSRNLFTRRRAAWHPARRLSLRKATFRRKGTCGRDLPTAPCRINATAGAGFGTGPREAGAHVTASRVPADRHASACRAGDTGVERQAQPGPRRAGGLPGVTPARARPDMSLPVGDRARVSHGVFGAGDAPARAPAVPGCGPLCPCTLRFPCTKTRGAARRQPPAGLVLGGEVTEARCFPRATRLRYPF